MANRERLREERDKKAREAQHGSPPPRHSSRWGTGSTSSSPSQKDSPPAAKKPKKAATKKPTKVPETQANGKEAETNDEETRVAGRRAPLVRWVNSFQKNMAMKLRLRTQKRQLKLMFLNNDSEYAMISDYVVGSASPTTCENEKEMGISKALSPEFETVQDLRKAIASPKMYTYPLLFDIFCAGLESGKLGCTKPMPMSRIDQVIMVFFEGW